MQLPNLTKTAERVTAVCLLLALIACFGSVVLFISSKTLKKENIILQNYIEAAEQVKPNFEASLQIYTENIEDAIAHVHSIRPSTELEYIEFISQVEAIADKLNVNMNLNSESLPPTITESVLRYELEFNGSQADLMDFLYELEFMTYYIRIQDINYTSLAQMAETGSTDYNIKITLDLYVQ